MNETQHQFEAKSLTGSGCNSLRHLEKRLGLVSVSKEKVSFTSLRKMLRIWTNWPSFYQAFYIRLTILRTARACLSAGTVLSDCVLERAMELARALTAYSRCAMFPTTINNSTVKNKPSAAAACITLTIFSRRSGLLRARSAGRAIGDAAARVWTHSVRRWWLNQTSFIHLSIPTSTSAACLRYLAPRSLCGGGLSSKNPLLDFKKVPALMQLRKVR